MLGLLFKEFRWQLLLAAGASVVSGACGVLLIAQINAALTAPEPPDRLALMFAAAAIVATATRMYSGVLFERLRQRASAQLREYICGRVIRAPFRMLEEVGAARIQSALSEHTSHVAQFFVSLPVLLTNGVTVLGCLIYLVALSPRIFAVTLPFIAVGSVIYHRAHLRAIKYLRAGTTEQDRLFEHFRSLTEGAKELRLNQSKRQRFGEQVLSQSIESVRRQRTLGMSLFVVASNWGNFLIYAFLGMVLFVVAGDLPDRARVLTGFALLIVYMVSPLQALLLSLPNANLAKVAAERIDELTQPMESSEPAAAESPAAGFRNLTLVGVKHRYYREGSDEKFEIGPIDLCLNRGEIVFLVGGNGSGKTTLAKLLCGLYPPEQGRIWLDGAPVEDGNRDLFRQRFSAVFSDFHLFENLLERQRPELDDRGNELLEALQLRHKVELRDGAFTTRSLSQGQRKRLALAVAYLEDRPVLIFDEWAADQDPAFKDVFYHRMLAELRAQEKTVLVISHDERYYGVADRLIRMENGRIVSVTATKPAVTPRLAADASL